MPKGATIIKKDVSITVEEIENGFLIKKSFDIKYSLGESNDTSYEYITKKWYSEDNPLSIEVDEDEGLSLADKFD